VDLTDARQLACWEGDVLLSHTKHLLGDEGEECEDRVLDGPASGGKGLQGPGPHKDALPDAGDAALGPLGSSSSQHGRTLGGGAPLQGGRDLLNLTSLGGGEASAGGSARAQLEALSRLETRLRSSPFFITRKPRVE